jgi:hypothetical protein
MDASTAITLDPEKSYEMSMPTQSAPTPHEMGCPRPQLPV